MGTLRILLLLAVCLGVVHLGRETGAFLARDQDGTLANVRPQPIRPLTEPVSAISAQTILKKESPLTRSLRVPEEGSQGTSALQQAAQTVTSLLGWHTPSASVPVTPRKLNTPAGSIRHLHRAAALHQAASARDDSTTGAADVTLGAVVTSLLNTGTLSGETSRRSLSETGADVIVRVVSVLNVRAGQLGEVRVELVDWSGRVLQAGGLTLDWGGSSLVGATGVELGLNQGLEVEALKEGLVAITFSVQEAGDYTLQLVLNGQDAASIPVTVYPIPALTTSSKVAASATAQVSQETTAGQAPKPNLSANLRETGNAFPGWEYLVGGVSLFLVASVVTVTIFAVRIRTKCRQQAGAEEGEERTAVSQAVGTGIQTSANEGEPKTVPDSTENSGEITGPQAFLWAVQETGGPGLEETRPNRGVLRQNRAKAKGSPRLLSMAVQKLRERNLEMEKKSGEEGNKKGEKCVEEPTQPGEQSEEREGKEESVAANILDEKVVSEQTESEKGETGEIEINTTTGKAVRNGATLQTENGDDVSDKKDGAEVVPGNGERKLEGDAQMSGHSFPILSLGERASPQGAQGSALWSPLTFSVPSIFIDKPASRKRRSPKGDPPKPRTPKPRKASIFKKGAESKRTKERELWSPVRFVSPPVAKPGKIRRTEGAETGREAKLPPGTETRRALTFRPTPLDIPRTKGPLRQSALWSPVKTFGESQPVDVLNVSENRGRARLPGVAVPAGGKENAPGTRQPQPTRFKRATKDLPGNVTKSVRPRMEEKEEKLAEAGSDLATPSGAGPVLWSPTFNGMMETEASPDTTAAKPEPTSPLKRMEEAPRVSKRLASGRATLSSTSGAEIAALLQELEKRTAGQVAPFDTLSPYTAYEKLVAEERKKKRSENRARFMSLGGDEMLVGNVVSASDLDSPRGVTMSYDVARGDDDVTLSAFVEV